VTPVVETIEHDGKRYAIIIRNTSSENGVHFFTPDDANLQVGAFHLSKNHEILPHIHNACQRTVHYTSEVLVVQSGKLQVDFYDAKRSHLLSRVLGAGDTVVLLEGGHGFRVLEELRMLEIKQGPYAGANDKTRFQRPK
jgi:hypothetical protein